MKNKLVLVTLLAFGAAIAARAAEDSYKIDPVHSTVGFSVRHMVINSVKGKFKQFSGTVVMDGETIKEAQGTIQTASVDTGNTQRDNDLRSPNFFDAAKYPTITFKTKQVEKKGDETILTGDYTMHGVTKEISLPVKVSGPVKDPFGGTRIGLEGKTKLNRKDFGMAYNKVLETGGLLVGDEVELEINAEAVKQTAVK